MTTLYPNGVSTLQKKSNQLENNSKQFEFQGLLS